MAEWLRALALKAARERPADPAELLLADVSALRYVLLHLFHATAQASAEGKHLLPDSVVKIRDQANVRKPADPRKLLACPRPDRTEASSGPSQAFSRPFGPAVPVPFPACGRPACPHPPGFG